MFPIAAITMRRERAGGTLDRLFTTPMSKLDPLAGYGTAFSLGALAQAVIVTLVAYRVTDLSTAGNPLLVAMVCVLTAILGVALGLFFSAFAETGVPGRAVRADRAGATAVPGRSVHPSRRDARLVALVQQVS